MYRADEEKKGDDEEEMEGDKQKKNGFQRFR